MPDTVCHCEPLLSHEQFQRELSYRAGLSIAGRMLAGKTISLVDYVMIEQKMAQKFSPVWGGLYSNLY